MKFLKEIRWTLPLCKIFGITVQLHATFLLLLGYFCWLGYQAHGLYGAMAAFLAVSLGFGSVLLHELGHCLTARCYGIRTRRILLMPIGGMAEMSTIPRRPKAELNITLAGPAVNFIIAGTLYLLFGWPRLGWEFRLFSLDPVHLAQLLLVWNLVMGLFNLIPVFPMDGGRILRALLAMRFEYLDATRIATYLAKAVIICVVIWMLLNENPNMLLLCLFAFIWIGGEAEYRHLRFMERYAALRIGDITLPWAGSPEDNGLMDKPHLNADWPLEIYARYFESHPESAYPVYHNGQFIGVVDTARLDSAVLHANRHLKELSKMAQGEP